MRIVETRPLSRLKRWRVDEIVAAGFAPEVVRRVIHLVDTSEYKRKQAAQGLKATSRAFGVGRRMPIAARLRDLS